MFDMSFFCPRAWHEPLRRLGGVRWYNASGRIGVGERMTLQVDYAVAQQAGGPKFVAMLRDLIASSERVRKGQGAIALFDAAAMARCLHIGPKLLTLDEPTCRALADTAIPIEVADYAMPYDAMIVRFPAAWCHEIAAQHNAPISNTLLLWHERELQLIVADVCNVNGAMAGSLMFNHNHIPGATIESRLPRMIGDDATYRAAAVLERVALNVGMLASLAGVKSAGWLDPAAHAKHEKAARKHDERGVRLLAGDVERIVFAQDIHLVLGVDVQDRTPWQGGTHASPHPHWRRRHWRMQPVGPGLARRKRILVKDTFVRARALPDGTTPADIQVDYTTEMPETPDDAQEEDDAGAEV